jgi:predicted GTPase
VEENDLEKVIKREGVDVVVFSYSDVAHPTVMHLASRRVAAGADFWLLGPTRTQVKSVVPVISVCAVRTGCGKSPAARLGPPNFARTVGSLSSFVTPCPTEI